MPESPEDRSTDSRSPDFDVFLCHHSLDKPAVKAIGSKLRDRGLQVWLGVWELRPGRSWLEALEEQIEQIGAAAVFVGQEGLGPWKEREIRGFLFQFVKRACPVIPVLLEDCPEPAPKLPAFLTDVTWVDFRKSDPDPLGQLIWGITGRKPEPEGPSGPRSAPARTDQPAGEDEDAVLAEWFAQVCEEHRRLGDHFERPVELRDLETAWVRLELALPEGSGELGRQDLGTWERLGDAHGVPRTLEDFLSLARKDYPWVTGRWLVEGDPGSGKTTLLRHLAGRLAAQEDRTRIPLFIPLPKIVKPLLMPLDHVAEEYGALCGEQLPGVLDRAGQGGRLLVLLDGLDEVPPERRDRVKRLLARLERDWPRSCLVVTSRPIGLGEPPPGFHKLLLQPLDDTQRERFLENWFRHRGAADPEAEAARASRHFDSERSLRELSHNPLHLTLLTVLWEKGVKAPTRRSELYDAIFELLLEGRHRNPPVAIPATVDVREVLRHLAFGLTRDDLAAEEPEELERRLWEGEIDAVRHRLVRIWGRHLRAFLDAVHERTYILGPHDGPRAAWRFWHRTFREALTAEWLREMFEGDEAALLEQLRPPGVLKAFGAIPRFLTLLRTWWRGHRSTATEVGKGLSLAFHKGDEGRWAEPFALLAGHLDEPDAWVRSLVESNRDLGLRALATAQGVSADVLAEILELSGGWEQRRQVFESIPEQLGDAEACLALVDRLRRTTRNGNDLFFLFAAVEDMAKRGPAYARQVRELEDRFFDHISVPEDPELFRSVDTPRDSRVKLWREIPAGEGWIGSPKSEQGRYRDEGPRHRVTIVRPFQLAAVPVTNAQCAAFDPEHADAERPDHPVARVTWYEAVSFCRWLAARVPGCASARLPTEEEWEYACRAGTETRYWSGDSEEALAVVGWYSKNSGGRLHRVGEKRANPWGLYDVHGNVWEWTASIPTSDFSGREAGRRVDPAAEPANLAATTGGVGRVVRGGGFSYTADWTRAAYRSGWDPRAEVGDQGFRVVLPAGPERP